MTRDPVDRAMEWDGLRPLGPVWEELARRMGASERPVRRIVVTGLDDRGRRSLASLLGLRRLPDQPAVALDAAKLAAALGLGREAELRRLVERICGPIGNRAAARAASLEARAALWSRVDERLGARVPGTLGRIRAAGVPGGDVDEHWRALALLADTLDRLPPASPVPLPMLAWQISGDPHVLDANTTCGRYLQIAAAEMAGIGSADREPDGSAARRALQELGVIVDRLSSAVITYGLRAQSDSPLGRMLEAGAAVATPVHVSGALLDAGLPRFSSGRWLCVENPSVVEAAVLAGYTGALVCTSGWPSLDAQRLLEAGRAQGIEVHYAGDYDTAGLLIADFMASRYGAKIAMTRAMYLAADLERASEWPEAGAVPPTPWDEGLAEAIRDRRRVVYQEDPAVWCELMEKREGSLQEAACPHRRAGCRAKARWQSGSF